MKILNSLYRRAIAWLMATPFYYWMLIHVIPYIRFTTYYTSLRGWKYHEIYKRVQPGDIILTIDRKKLTSLLIPGEWTHAAQVISKDGAWEASEMTHHDYTRSCIFDLCKESDRVLVLRCTDYDEQYIQNVVIPKCKALQGARYDIQFDLGVEALYCSELVYQSDAERRLQVSLEDIQGLGRQYISPVGLSKAKNCVVVVDSDDLGGSFYPPETKLP